MPGTGGGERGRPRVRPRPRVGVEVPAAGAQRRLERVEVRGRVHPLELGHGSPPRPGQGDQVGRRDPASSMPGVDRLRGGPAARGGPAGVVLRRRPGRSASRSTQTRYHRRRPMPGPSQPGIAAPTLDPAMTDDTLRWRGGWARLGSWRGEPTSPTSPSGADRPPTPEIVDRCLRTAPRPRVLGRRPTSALAPADALPFVDAGLLGPRAAPPPRPRPRATSRTADHRRPARARTERPTPRSSRSTTGRSTAFWRLDDDGLDQRARRHPVEPLPGRRRRTDGTARGYAVTGRAGPPRLPPAGRRRPGGAGARASGARSWLDALRWLRRHGAPTTRRQHPARQRRRARALRGVRVPRAAERAVRDGPVPVRRRAAAVARGRARASCARRAAVAAAAPVAAAARAEPAASAARRQPAWSTLGDDVQLRLAITRPTGAALEVRAIVHCVVTSRTAFERTINGERLGSTITLARAAGRRAARCVGGGPHLHAATPGPGRAAGPEPPPADDARGPGPPASSRSRSSCATPDSRRRARQLRHPPRRGRRRRRRAAPLADPPPRGVALARRRPSPPTTAGAARRRRRSPARRARGPARPRSTASTALIGGVPLTLVPEPGDARGCAQR